MFEKLRCSIERNGPEAGEAYFSLGKLGFQSNKEVVEQFNRLVALRQLIKDMPPLVQEKIKNLLYEESLKINEDLASLSEGKVKEEMENGMNAIDEFRHEIIAIQKAS